VPLVRDFHFYFAHRLIHFRALYKYIHSLHHRNNDIEPFSGLCMHPIEHLYYMTCMGASLYFLMSPFHLMWNGFHLVLSPAASHSGWEDHWQADLFHYLHHAFFECNYGTTAIPTDYWFGTYRDKLGVSTTYKGASEEKIVLSEKKKEGSQKKGLSISDAIPTVQFFQYALFSTIFFVILGWSLANEQMFDKRGASLMAAFIAVGPMVAATILWYYSGDRFPFLWPFHKEPIGTLLFHVIVSTILCVIPVYHLMFSALGPTSTYCTLWGC